MKYKILLSDGTTIESTHRDPNLEQMQCIVGGYIELVSVLHNGKRTTMVVNEEGACNGMPINRAATEIYHEFAQFVGRDWKGAPYIHGDAILFEREMR